MVIPHGVVFITSLFYYYLLGFGDFERGGYQVFVSFRMLNECFVTNVGGYLGRRGFVIYPIGHEQGESKPKPIYDFRAERFLVVGTWGGIGRTGLIGHIGANRSVYEKRLRANRTPKVAVM